MRLKGKLVLITGGSEALASRLARRSCARVVNFASSVEVRKSWSRRGGDCRRLSLSSRLISPPIVASTSLPNILRGREGTLDILVSNAAVADFTAFEKVTAEQYQRSLALNLSAPFFLTLSLLPDMTTPGASVINISSYFAHKMIAGRPSTLYSLTKGAIDAFTKSFAFEPGPRGIRVNAIAPGSVDSPMRQNFVTGLAEAQRTDPRRYVERSYPLGRIGSPSDLGEIAVYLASDEAAWTSGAIFAIDGGYTAG
jgi:NAD(P)-dependent dehydrogenase (short-subunit alcohol dehydrogenase family)